MSNHPAEESPEPTFGEQGALDMDLIKEEVVTEEDDSGSSYQGLCLICGSPGVSDAYYCKDCTVQEKDRDGCPKIVNLGSSKTDLFYEMKKYGFKKR